MRRRRRPELLMQAVLMAGAALSVAACLPQEDLSSYTAGAAPSSTELASGVIQHAVDANAAGSLPPPSPLLLPEPMLSLDAGLSVRDTVPPAAATPGFKSDAGSPPPDAAKPGAWRGKSTQRLSVAGLDRAFIYYAPERLDPALPASILIVAHGFSVSAEQLFAITGFDSLADRKGFLLAFPIGQGVAPWNIGADTCPGTLGPIPQAAGDDQAFVDEILKFVESDRALDREHVFVSGFASGGYFANETGCARPEVRAVSSHSGGSHDLRDCSTERKPVIIFHGVLDELVPVECGVETRARWAERNGCAAEVDYREVLGGACEHSRGCLTGGQVTLCLFDQLGQAWAGGFGQAGTSNTSFASAAELTWEFFEQYAW